MVVGKSILSAKILYAPPRSINYCRGTILWKITVKRLPKVIWEQAASNSPLVTLQWRAPHLPQITPSCGPIPKPYLPHPWTHPTYHPKPHPYLISHFATMHWTDRQKDRPTDGWR